MFGNSDMWVRIALCSLILVGQYHQWVLLPQTLWIVRAVTGVQA